MAELHDFEAVEIAGLAEDAVRNIMSHAALWFQAATGSVTSWGHRQPQMAR